ncbi:MAG: LacI family DNA-binding transcriptional regulator [Mangrovicoccus sp.]
MRRPTIADLAQEAGVSVSTVNRILAGSAQVRGTTMQRVQSAAEKIGFYGVGAIEDRLRKTVPNYRLGFLLQQSSREIYQLFGKNIIAACRSRRDEVIDPVVEYVDLLSPEHISERLLDLGRQVDAVAVIAADHPLIAQTIRSLHEEGKPTICYITDQTAPERAAFVGTDNWKLGRTAGWLITQMSAKPGRIAVYIGHHRYHCQDMADAGMRSFIRENAPHLTVDETRTTHEDSEIAYRLVSELLETSDDVIGILKLGGGISGVLRALREAPAKKRQNIRLICRDIGPAIRIGLSEGIITAALCHSLTATPELLVATMIEATDPTNQTVSQQRTLPFEIVTPESI